MEHFPDTGNVYPGSMNTSWLSILGPLEYVAVFENRHLSSIGVFPGLRQP